MLALPIENPNSCEVHPDSRAASAAAVCALAALLAAVTALWEGFPLELGPDDESSGESRSAVTVTPSISYVSSSAVARPMSPEAVVASTSRRTVASGSTYRGRSIASRRRLALAAAAPGAIDDMLKGILSAVSTPPRPASHGTLWLQNQYKGQAEPSVCAKAHP